MQKYFTKISYSLFLLIYKIYPDSHTTNHISNHGNSQTYIIQNSNTTGTPYFEPTDDPHKVHIFPFGNKDFSYEYDQRTAHLSPITYIFRSVSNVSAVPLQYIQNNSKKIYTRCLFGAYLFINYWLFQKSTYLQSPQRWGIWKAHLSLSQMLSIPSEELRKELLAEIKMRYGANQSSANESDAILLFIKDSDAEIVILKRYQYMTRLIQKLDLMSNSIGERIQNFVPYIFKFIPSFLNPFNFIGSLFSSLTVKYKISNLFFVDNSFYLKIEELISKITYLKQLVTQWLATQKIKLLKKNGGWR